MPVLVGCVVLRVRAARSRTISGGFGVGETPLPIPNRAVKPHSADGTWPSRAWESRSPPVLSFTSRPSGGSLRLIVTVPAAEFPSAIRTARLPLRRWEPGRDDAAFAELNAQPEVMRFVDGGVPASR